MVHNKFLLKFHGSLRFIFKARVKGPLADQKNNHNHEFSALVLLGFFKVVFTFLTTSSRKKS